MTGKTRRAFAALCVSCAFFGAAGTANADIWGTNFEGPEFIAGDIHGQDGWQKVGPFDVAVANTSGFPAASSYGFGARALRVSNATTSGSFGDQTFSPSVVDEAGESGATSSGNAGGKRQSTYALSFRIGTTSAASQSGLAATISPDSGTGNRMSFLRFEDGHADGTHVIFYDVSNPGPLPTASTFNASDVATLSRGSSHLVELFIKFVDGPGNDHVKVQVDGVVVATGTSWENYYRFDPEQNGNGNVLPTVDDLLVRVSGTAAPATAGQGFLFDDFRIQTGPTPGPGPAGPQGPAGPHGSDGSQGSTGATGQSGANGLQGPAGAPGLSAQSGVTLHPVAIGAAKTSGNAVRVRVKCPKASGNCDGNLRLVKGSRTVSRKHFTIDGGKSETVRLKVKPALKTSRFKLVALSRDDAGTASRTTKAFSGKVG